MNYAIICDARVGEHLGIDTLGFVDRRKSRKYWWTSDDPSLLMKFTKKTAAEGMLRRLTMNNPQVVDYESARSIIEEQRAAIIRNSANDEAGWNAHKDGF